MGIKGDLVPQIKGSSKEVKQKKSSCYLTFYDKQVLFKILTKRGVKFDDAKKRIEELNNKQNEIFKKMKAKNKPESEIRQKQVLMLEELWNI